MQSASPPTTSNEVFALSLLGALAERVEVAWNQRRPDRVLARYAWVSGLNVSSGAAPPDELANAMCVELADVLVILANLRDRGFVLRLEVAGEDAYIPTPLGYWIARRSGGRAELETIREEVLSAITNALEQRWRDAVRSEKPETVAMPAQYALFLLFLLVGGAIDRAHALRWDKTDAARAEAARDLLLSLSCDVKWDEGRAVWTQNEELANLTRRPELRRYFGRAFKKDDNRRASESLLFFDVEPTAEGLVPLMMAVERSLGSEPVVSALSSLERTPWSKGRFGPKAHYIRQLFGRHLCPESYRQLLTSSALEAAKRLKPESGASA